MFPLHSMFPPTREHFPPSELVTAVTVIPIGGVHTN